MSGWRGIRYTNRRKSSLGMGASHWTGNPAPAGAVSTGDAPPIFFSILLKRKRAAPGPKEKAASAGRSAQAQTSCRRRGIVGGPSRQSGTETPGPWGNLRSGEVQGYPLRRFSLPLTLPQRTRQRVAKRNARKEKQIKCDFATRRSQQCWHGSAVAILQKILACPKDRQNRSRYRSADPRRARRATAPERA